MIAKLNFKGCNCYLVESGGKRYLVDTGTPGNLKRAKEQLDSIDGIIITHGHYDHCGSAVEIADHFSCRIYAHRDEHPYLEGKAEFRFDGFVGRFIKRLERLRPMEHFKAHDVESLNLNIVHLPGHTPGSIGIVVGNEMLCGDLLRVGRKYLIAGEIVVKPSSRNFNWSQEKYIESLKRFAELDVEAIHPGHGESVRINKTLVGGIIKRLEG